MRADGTPLSRTSNFDDLDSQQESRQPQFPYYGPVEWAVIWASMFVYFALRFDPTAATVANTAINIKDSITAYSTAVAASSSLRNRVNQFMAYLRRAASASSSNAGWDFFVRLLIQAYTAEMSWQKEILREMSGFTARLATRF
jgi:hypothetical protein